MTTALLIACYVAAVLTENWLIEHGYIRPR